jgi:hypothetical protein
LVKVTIGVEEKEVDTEEGREHHKKMGWILESLSDPHDTHYLTHEVQKTKKNGNSYLFYDCPFLPLYEKRDCYEYGQSHIIQKNNCVCFLVMTAAARPSAPRYVNRIAFIHTWCRKPRQTLVIPDEEFSPKTRTCLIVARTSTYIPRPGEYSTLLE